MKTPCHFLRKAAVIQFGTELRVRTDSKERVQNFFFPPIPLKYLRAPSRAFPSLSSYKLIPKYETLWRIPVPRLAYVLCLLAPEIKGDSPSEKPLSLPLILPHYAPYTLRALPLTNFEAARLLRSPADKAICVD